MRFLVTLALLGGVASQADARRYRSFSPQPQAQSASAVSSSPQDIGPVVQQLAEVNRQRAMKGLRPYVLCVELQRAAEECARYRARYRIRGHTSSDMSFAAPGYATCAGCAAWNNDGSYGACAIDGNYTYAGAATVVGMDGLAYHQLLLR